jgi:tyrosine-protein phosphatase SIW14
MLGKLGMMIRKAWIAILLGLLLASCAGPSNLHKVDDKVWRSGQPARYQFRELKKQGVGEVLCLRRWHSDINEAPGMDLHHVRMNAGKIKDEQIVRALRAILAADQPILVHCFHGADRTGAVIAMYRMVVQDWPRQKAIDEFMDPKYGHHADYFPNIREYLEKVDIEKIRREVFTSPAPRSDTRAELQLGPS